MRQTKQDKYEKNKTSIGIKLLSMLIIVIASISIVSYSASSLENSTDEIHPVIKHIIS